MIIISAESCHIATHVRMLFKTCSVGLDGVGVIVFSLRQVWDSLEQLSSGWSEVLEHVWASSGVPGKCRASSGVLGKCGASCGFPGKFGASFLRDKFAWVDTKMRVQSWIETVSQSSSSLDHQLNGCSCNKSAKFNCLPKLEPYTKQKSLTTKNTCQTRRRHQQQTHTHRQNAQHAHTTHAAEHTKSQNQPHSYGSLSPPHNPILVSSQRAVIKCEDNRLLCDCPLRNSD